MFIVRIGSKDSITLQKEQPNFCLSVKRGNSFLARFSGIWC